MSIRFLAFFLIIILNRWQQPSKNIRSTGKGFGRLGKKEYLRYVIMLLFDKYTNF